MDGSMRDTELEVMEQLDELLDSVGDREIQRRVVEWLAARRGWRVIGQGTGLEVFIGNQKGGFVSSMGMLVPRELGILFEKVNPKTEFEKALVVCYFVQIVMGSADVSARVLNQYLTGLGHRIKNITAVLRWLTERKPQLVLQYGKKGESQQSHKKYRMTFTGIQWVESRLT